MAHEGVDAALLVKAVPSAMCNPAAVAQALVLLLPFTGDRLTDDVELRRGAVQALRSLYVGVFGGTEQEALETATAWARAVCEAALLAPEGGAQQPDQ